MNAILAWLKSKNISTHTIAVALIAAATIISSDQTVRDFILTLFKDHPIIGTDLIALAGIILKYSHSLSDAGAVANAKAILDKPDSPTVAQVDAATPSK